MKRMKKENPDRHYKMVRKANLSKYGITIEEYERIFEQQDGKCKICDNVANGKGRLHVDHCHDTGKVRGLLCSSCNIGLGLFKHNADLLNEAIGYVV